MIDRLEVQQPEIKLDFCRLEMLGIFEHGSLWRLLGQECTIASNKTSHGVLFPTVFKYVNYAKVR